MLFHVDAAQAAGKYPIDLDATPIDLLTASAHKLHGPKGIGCLIIRNRRQLRLAPLMFGGEQEHGLRPGTFKRDLKRVARGWLSSSLASRLHEDCRDPCPGSPTA